MNDVTIIEGQGGLGRPLPGQDHLSGLILYSDDLPSGFTTDDNKKQVLSVLQAESLGILDDLSDETPAVGSYKITAVGDDGDTLTLKFAEPDGTIVTLGSYTKVTADTTAALVATAIIAAINALTGTHGYTAVVDGGDATQANITARPGLGIYPNSGTPFSAVIVGDITGTLTQFADGVASQLNVWHYLISEYFRLNPKGNIWVGFFPISDNDWDAAEIVLMQTKANGTIRQFGIYYGNTGQFNTADGVGSAADLIQVQAAAIKALHQPAQFVFTVDIKAITDLTTLINLGTRTDQNVSATIGQDGANNGADIFAASGYSISDLGAKLGAISAAKVSESIEWVGKFNFTDGSELSVPAISNGVLISALSANLLDQLNTYRYLFLRTFSGNPGTFANDSHTAVAASSDYAYIEDNRTAQKAERNLYTAFVPLLGSPLKLNADGTLSDITLAYFSSVANSALDPMVRDEEISAYGIVIDPTQNVLVTGTMALTAQIVKQGVARNIVITLSFVNSIT